MEYKYYSTQRPVDIGTFPKPPGNLPLEIVNYDERVWIEDESLRAWGELTYAKPLTQIQMDDYELKASRHNPVRIRKYPLDATTERFEVVRLLDVPALFTTLRVNRATVPRGMYLYELQTSYEDRSRPGLLGRRINVQHFGTVLTAVPVKLDANGYRNLSPEEFDIGTGEERMSAAEFRAVIPRPALATHPRPKRGTPQRGER